MFGRTVTCPSPEQGDVSLEESRKEALASVICSVEYYNNRRDHSFASKQMQHINEFKDLCCSSHLMLPKYDGGAEPAILMAVDLFL